MLRGVRGYAFNRTNVELKLNEGAAAGVPDALLLIEPMWN